MDRTHRFTKAFKFGLRGGRRRHFTPSAARVCRNSAQNFASRSSKVATAVQISHSSNVELRATWPAERDALRLAAQPGDPVVPNDRRAFAALRQSELKTALARALKETAMNLYSYVNEGPARKHVAC
jgi:hypothetical protein